MSADSPSRHAAVSSTAEKQSACRLPRRLKERLGNVVIIDVTKAACSACTTTCGSGQSGPGRRFSSRSACTLRPKAA